MRHRVKGRKLGRTASHRRATLSALSTSLIEHKRIRTTLAKAKETQRTIEPLITRARLAYQKESSDGTKDIAARREIARFIKKPSVVRELFEEIAPKVIDRNGGYTRVVKLGQRDGDGAELAIIEFVDYNEAVTRKAKEKKRAAKAVTPPADEKSTASSEVHEETSVVVDDETREKTSDEPTPDETDVDTKSEASIDDSGEKARDNEPEDQQKK